MKHTPGPWGHVGALIRAPDGNRTIATVWGEGLVGSQQEADVWRIVACVNACEGINPEAVPDLLEALTRAEQTLRNLAFGFLDAEANTIAQNEAANIRAALAKAKE